MNKNAALLVLASVALLDQISSSMALGVVNPKLDYSILALNATSPTKLRIESYPAASSGLEFCSIWLQSTNYTGFARYYYNFTGAPIIKGILNPPPFQTYKDIDVVDGTTECNIVAMDTKFWHISGSSLKNYTSTSETYDAIGVSNTESAGFNVVLREGTQIPPFNISFMEHFETRRLSASTVLVAGVAYGSGNLYIGILAGSAGTKFGDYTTMAKPTSISIAVYSPTNWVVCTVTLQLECVFSRNDSSITQVVSTPFTPTMAAISFVDCDNLAYVIATQTKYFLTLVDVTTLERNNGGYASTQTNVFTAIHMATTQKITSVIVSNTTGVFIDFFSWSFQSSCIASPVASTTPSSTPMYSPASNPTSNTPPSTPESSPVNPPNGTTNPGSQSPSSNVEGPKSDGSTPPSVDAVALGVGIAVPVAVLGAGAFLLVFLLRRRNKKTQDKAVSNPVNDINNPPSILATAPGVYQNLPSNNTTNKTTYTSLGNVTNDSFTTASAAIELPEIDKRLHIPYKSLVFIKEIGAGSYGKVFLGEWRGAKVAIKVNNQITDVDGFLAEAKLTLGIAPHPNLVQTFGVSLDGPNPCIVLEYCGGGSLDQLLYDSTVELDVAKQREFAMKIAYGLLHLHNNNIVHRDLAARNILLTNDQQPKISDFGMSRIVKDEGSKGQTKTSFGPIRWMAPESLRDRSYSVKSDVWTYGIVVNEIISRTEPHVNEDQLSIAVKIRDQAATPEIPSDGDPALVEVIHKCLKAEPKDRPTMDELCQFLRAKID